jgi:hypothetical protein
MNKRAAYLLGLALFGSIAACQAQGTINITFDRPIGGPGMDYFLQSYSESDMFFKPQPGCGGFGLITTPSPDLPNNGTGYLQAGQGENLTFNLLSSPAFSLQSVDLAGLSSSTSGYMVDFLGHRSDGSTVETIFSGSGIDFQTYHFGSGWSDLTDVEIKNSNWSLDNLVFQTDPEPNIASVPEPSIGALFVLGGLAWQFRKMKRASTRA